MTAIAQRYPTYKRLTAGIVILLGIVWVGYLLVGRQTTEPGTGVLNGAKAPDFTLKSPDGQDIKLSDFKGKPVMLNFFATWCQPCRNETPIIQEVYKEHQAEGFTVLAVNMGETNLAVSDFIKQLGLTFPIVIDQNDKVTKMYDIIPLPTSYFIDKNGVVQGKWTGEISKDKLESFVKTIQ